MVRRSPHSTITPADQLAHEPPGERVSDRPSAIGVRLRQYMANILVLAALGIFAWFGHHTDWTFGILSAREPVESRPDALNISFTVDLSSPSDPSRQLCSPHGVFD
jgi:hypothetical protein